jgi:transposase InsO family protein
MDVSIFRPSDYSRVYLYFILDNFSRAILGWKASLQYSSEIAFENLKEVCNKYDLSNSSVQLVVDDGPENNGCVNDFLSIPGIQLKKLIAQVDIRQSNSMIIYLPNNFRIFMPLKPIYPVLLNPLIINL